MSELTDKLTSGNVQDLDGGRFFMVDKAKSATLHADILADKYVLPAGWLLILKDGATTIAKIGDGVAKWTDAIPLGGGGAGGAVAWGDITGKPVVIGAGATAADARTAIGAGTSNLVIGTTTGTAADGLLAAPKASPTFTGTPNSVTAALGTNTVQIATTAFVLANAGKTKTQIAALVSPATDYTDLTAVTAAIKSIIDALKA